MAIVKHCAAPKNGGSARGAIRYAAAYTVGDKEDPIKAAKQYEAMMDEANLRDDLGVGVVFRPEFSDGKRPSSVFAANVGSLATADIEMQITASSNKAVREPVSHWVFSFGKDAARPAGVTDEEMHQAVSRWTQLMGADDHERFQAVHRDTVDKLGRAAPHIHLVLGNVHPKTYQILDQHNLHERAHHAMRVVESEMGLSFDMGLYAARQGDEIIVGDGSRVRGEITIEKTTRAERAKFKDETTLTREEQLADARRRGWSDVQMNDTTFARYAGASVGVRLRKALDRVEDVGVKPTWNELHVTAAERGTKFEMNSNGKLWLVDVPWRDKDGNPPTGTPARVLVSEIHIDDVLERVGAYKAADDAASEWEAMARKNPSVILNEMEERKGVWTRSDLDAFVGPRVDDAGALVELSEAALKHKNVVAIDEAHGVYTTRGYEELEDRLYVNLTTMAKTKDETFDHAAWDRAKQRFCDEQKAHNPAFRGFTPCQADALDVIGRTRFSSLSGDAGTGKSSVMRVVSNYCEEKDIPLIGVATSAQAAKVLSESAKLQGYNLKLVLTHEEHAVSKIPRGACVIADETGMTGSKDYGALVDALNYRGCKLIDCGDTNQLQSPSAGSGHRIAQKVAEENGVHAMMTTIVRQSRIDDGTPDGKPSFMLRAATDIAAAMKINGPNKSFDPKAAEAQKQEFIRICEGLANPATVTVDGVPRYPDEAPYLIIHKNRDEMLRAAVDDYVDATSRNKSFMIIADTNEDVRHLDEMVRERLGITGGFKFYSNVTGWETLLTPGDRWRAGRIDNTIGVLNGELGTVTAVSADRVTVQLDGLNGEHGKTISFDPRPGPDGYEDWARAYARTNHKGQGTTVDECSMTGGGSANLAYVGMTRGTGSNRWHVDGAKFPDAKALGEALHAEYNATTLTYDEKIAGQLRDEAHIKRRDETKSGAILKDIEDREKRQRSLENHFARPEYEAEMAERRETRQAEILRITAATNIELASIKAARKSLPQGFDAGLKSAKDLDDRERAIKESREARQRAVAIEWGPMRFREWLDRRGRDQIAEIATEQLLVQARSARLDKPNEETADRHEPVLVDRTQGKQRIPVEAAVKSVRDSDRTSEAQRQRDAAAERERQAQEIRQTQKQRTMGM